MIVNLYSILMIFISCVGLVLGLLLLKASLTFASRIGTGGFERQSSESERRLHWVRLLAQPFQGQGR